MSNYHIRTKFEYFTSDVSQIFLIDYKSIFHVDRRSTFHCCEAILRPLKKVHFVRLVCSVDVKYNPDKRTHVCGQERIPHEQGNSVQSF